MVLSGLRNEEYEYTAKLYDINLLLKYLLIEIIMMMEH